MKLSYSFSAALWEPPGKRRGFVTMPEADSDEILDEVPRRPGFGSVRVTATIGATEWSTSLFPSKEFGSYVLPVKRGVRLSEGIDVGDVARVTLEIEIDEQR